MPGSRWFAISLLLGVVTATAGCDMPVRVGVREARAAGINVPGPAMPLFDRTMPIATDASSAVQPAALLRPAQEARPPIVPVAFTGGLLHLPAVPQPHGPDDVVGVLLQRDGPQSGERSVTFGQVFMPGQLGATSGIAARIDGHDEPAQLDVKATNPDGSVRFGVVTVHAAAPASIMLVHTSKPAAPAVDLAKLAGHDALAVDLVLHGAAGDTPRHFDVANLLSEALAAGKASYWLRGPLVTEARVIAPVTGSFRLAFDVRAYADGAILTDVAFDNDYAMQPSGGEVEYDATITQNGKSVLRQAGIKQFQYQTWHREVWSDGAPPINVVRDIAAMERAGAIQNYDLAVGVAPELVADEVKALSSPGFLAILGNAGVTKYMPTTGGRDDIGPLTTANTLWLVTQHPDAARYALAQDDAAGSIPIHFFDAVAGSYVTVEKYPKLWIDDRGGNGGDTTGLTQKVGNTGWAYDNAHQPELTYVPYLMTGSRYRLDQFEAQATATVLNVWSAPRENQKGIVANNNTQVRAAGWSLRQLVEAAYALPDASPLKRYFEQLVANNIAYLRDEAAHAHQGEAEGWVPVHTDPWWQLGPWQEDFLVTSLALAARQNVAGARDLLNWMTNFTAGKFLSADKGFPPFAGGTAVLVVTDGSGQPLQTWKQILDATVQHGPRGFIVDNGTRFGPETYRTALATDHGSLAALFGATGNSEAKRAFDWLTENAPQIGHEWQIREPSWNIVPVPPPP